ncbi:YihY/virulence factor BrkB family protein [Streptomyces sp. HNM0574]|uniref:YihY/virulence factor BrkB family protein n=1 Tax=Streptomyces sp. HNM0574 TaxID=2714954 RepID=UPI00146C39C2|nr:YihY/virulence factor BrkB family protein [Streptomyces sp. HNM0574]NLU66808.1 YihY/virulence factor BrkB family protein [Streptomyces sp. HNM0574]
MDWLTRLPVIGPVAAWFFRTRLWHVYLHLDARKWTRLAAALTFTSFLALFPILAVGAAIGAATLTPSRMKTVQDWMADQVPGISDQLDLQSLVDNAGTVGVVAGVLLLVTGVGWAGTLRECLRAMWDLEEDPGNPVVLKLRDLGVLVGLGAIGLLSMAGSTFAVSAVNWTASRMGLVEGGVGTVLLRLAGYAAAVAVDFVLLCYVLTLLPRVSPPRRATVWAALMGAVGFELLKALLGGYLQGVAAKNMYGAFGVPIALLLWISFMAKLLLFCSAWTATEPLRGGRTASEQAVAEEEAASAETETEAESDENAAARAPDAEPAPGATEADGPPGRKG